MGSCKETHTLRTGDIIYLTRRLWKRNCRLVIRKKKLGLCWEWKFGITSAGYGQIFGVIGFSRAHRYAYKIFKGFLDSAPILHRCDNKICVNPKHLYRGSAAQNVKDAWDRHPNVRKRKELLAERNRTMYQDKEFRQTRSRLMKNQFKDPEFMAAHRKRSSERSIKMWQDPIYSKKMRNLKRDKFGRLMKEQNEKV